MRPPILVRNPCRIQQCQEWPLTLAWSTLNAPHFPHSNTGCHVRMCIISVRTHGWKHWNTSDIQSHCKFIVIFIIFSGNYTNITVRHSWKCCLQEFKNLRIGYFMFFHAFYFASSSDIIRQTLWVFHLESCSQNQRSFCVGLQLADVCTDMSTCFWQ